MSQPTENEILLSYVQGVLEDTGRQLINWESQLRKTYGLDADFLQQQLQPLPSQTRGRLRLQPQRSPIFTTINGLEYRIRVDRTHFEDYLPFTIKLERPSSGSVLSLGYKDAEFVDLSYIEVNGVMPERKSYHRIDLDSGKISYFKEVPFPNLTFEYKGKQLTGWEADVWDNSLDHILHFKNGKAQYGHDGADIIYVHPEQAIDSPNLQVLPISARYSFNPVPMLISFPNQLAELLPST